MQIIVDDWTGKQEWKWVHSDVFSLSLSTLNGQLHVNITLLLLLNANKLNRLQIYFLIGVHIQFHQETCTNTSVIYRRNNDNTFLNIFLSVIQHFEKVV